MVIFLPDGARPSNSPPCVAVDMIRMYDDPVALDHDVIDALGPVRERNPMALDRTLDAREPLPPSSSDKGANKIRGIQFICHSEIALVPQLGFGAESDRFVLRQFGSWP